MGAYVDAYKYNLEYLRKYTADWGGDEALEFLDIALTEFGEVFGNWFVTISDEHAEDYNAAWEFGTFMELAMKFATGNDREYLPTRSFIPTHANAYEVLEDHGIEYDGGAGAVINNA